MQTKIDGEKLQRAAFLKGWNIRDLSERSGVGPGTVRLVLAGVGSPKSIKKIADTLEVPMEELFYPEQERASA